jgi:hypothetical protein
MRARNQTGVFDHDLPGTRDIKQKEKQLKMLCANTRTNWVKQYQMTLLGDYFRNLFSTTMHQCKVMHQNLVYSYHWTAVFFDYAKPILEQINQPLPKYNLELQQIVKQQIARTLQYQDDFGNTILHNILIYATKALRRCLPKEKEAEVKILNVLRTLINRSKFPSGKTVLSVVNLEGYTPMHLIIKLKNATLIKGLLTEHAKELSSFTWNKPQTFLGHFPQVSLPIPYSCFSVIKKMNGAAPPDTSVDMKGIEHYMLIPDLQKRYKEPMTLLNMMLLYYSSSECIYLLEELGICDITALANVQCSRTGHYPLHFLMFSYANTTIKKGRGDEMLDLAQDLINRGADVTVCNSQGYSPVSMLVYAHEVVSCFVSKQHVLDMIKLLMSNTIDDLLNDKFPAYHSTVGYVILRNWSYSKLIITWMIVEGRALITKAMISKLAKDYKIVMNVGEKLRLLEKLGIDMRVDMDQISNRNLAMKEVFHMPAKPPRVPKHPYKKDMEFWNELLFDKHFGVHDRL